MRVHSLMRVASIAVLAALPLLAQIHASDWLVLRAVALPVVLPASMFSEILEKRTTTALAYEGVPLATLAASARGHALDADLHPGADILDPVLGKCCDGRSRCMGNAEYDWLRDGRHIQYKSAQLTWNSSPERLKNTSLQCSACLRDGAARRCI